MYNNLTFNSSFIFSAVSSGVDVYTKDLDYLGSVLINNNSSIYSNSNDLYIATNSGVFTTPISSISGCVFDDISIFKQVPNITSNNVNYIHGTDDYLLATTDSGVDNYNLKTYSRVYNRSAFESTKCFQTTAGGFYYVSKDSSDPFLSLSLYKSIIYFNRPTPIPNYQVKLIITETNFDYNKTTIDGSDICFYSVDGNPLYFYIEAWISGSTSTVWVKVYDIGTPYIYMLHGKPYEGGYANPSMVFDLYDDFDYPVTTYSDNVFLPIYGNITVSGTPHPEYLYDGNLSGYYSYSFPTSGDYFQIEFFTPKIISKIRLKQTSYGVDIGFYIYASNSGSFSGEESLVYYRTTQVSPDFYFLISAGVPYTYYRVVRGAGTTWQLIEVQFFERSNLSDLTTVSGSIWDSISNIYSIIIPEESSIACISYNDDYINSIPVLSVPIVIEQRIKAVFMSDATLAGYSVSLSPNEDGAVWYRSGPKTFEAVFSGNSTLFEYDPSKNMINEWGILTVEITTNTIRCLFESTSLSFSKCWGGPISLGANRCLHLKISNAYVDWIRTRQYTSYEVFVDYIETITMEPKYKLNAVYSNLVDWTDSNVDYIYEVEDGAIINDIFVTEGTSIHSNGNVIFVATNRGVVVIEEKRGDENNSRIKYLK